MGWRAPRGEERERARREATGSLPAAAPPSAVPQMHAGSILERAHEAIRETVGSDMRPLVCGVRLCGVLFGGGGGGALSDGPRTGGSRGSSVLDELREPHAEPPHTEPPYTEPPQVEQLDSTDSTRRPAPRVAKASERHPSARHVSERPAC